MNDVELALCTTNVPSYCDGAAPEMWTMLPTASELLLMIELLAAAVTRPDVLLYVRLVTLSVVGVCCWSTVMVAGTPPQVTVYWACESGLTGLLSPS